jgi:hypothetical protein
MTIEHWQEALAFAIEVQKRIPPGCEHLAPEKPYFYEIILGMARRAAAMSSK